MPRSKHSFDVKGFLANIGKGRKIVRVRKKQTIYGQGASQERYRRLHLKHTGGADDAIPLESFLLHAVLKLKNPVLSVR
jgi:hypothetical protein